MITITDLRARIKDTKGRDTDFMGLCPGHDDHTPSLHVTQKPDGTILLCCLSGCTQEQVLVALGISKGDLFPDTTPRKRTYTPRKSSGKQKPEAIYEYKNSRGHVLYRKLRYPGKRFVFEQPDIQNFGKWKPGLDGIEMRPLYELETALHAIENGFRLYLSESEKDVDCLADAGECCCSSGGANNWRSDHADVLRNAKDLVVLVHKDDAGREHARVVKRDCPQARCIELPDCTNDAADYLASHSPEEFRAAVELELSRPEPSWLTEPITDAAPSKPSTPRASNIVPLSPPPIISTDNVTAILSEHCTEKRAAEYFVREYGAFVKWCPGIGMLVWDGTRWAKDDAGKVVTMAMEVGQQFRVEAANYSEPKIAEGFYRWAKTCESANGIEHFLELAKPALHVPIDDLDAEPWTLNFRNGTVDLRSLDDETRPHRAADNITKLVPGNFSLGAAAPKWRAFLKRILPDPEVREYIQRAIGYSLSGSVKEQCFFVLHGSGCNGKSTLLDVLLSVLGPDYAAQADPRSFLTSRNDGCGNDLARLRGIRFLSCVETGEGRRLDESLVKSLTGGDAIVARFLYREQFQFKPEFKLWIASNHKPSIRDTSAGMWRRVRLIPFEVQIPDDEIDRDLKDKLLQETEGILAWALEGAALYQEVGLAEPRSVLAATKDYREQEDLLADFLRECCVLQEAAMSTTGELHEAYCRFTSAKTSPIAFGRLLTERVGVGDVEGVNTSVVRGRRVFRGIGLRQNETLFN